MTRKRGPKPYGRERGLGRKVAIRMGGDADKTLALVNNAMRADTVKSLADRTRNGVEVLLSRKKQNVKVTVSLSRKVEKVDRYMRSVVKNILSGVGKKFQNKFKKIEISSPLIRQKKLDRHKTVYPETLAEIVDGKNGKVLRLLVPVSENLFKTKAVKIISSEIVKMINGEKFSEKVLTQPIPRGRGRPSKDKDVDVHWSEKISDSEPRKKISEKSVIPF